MEKKLTPFQRYKLRINVRLNELHLLDSGKISALSQAERWELVYLEEVIKDIENNVLGDEEIFAKDCFCAGKISSADNFDTPELDEDFSNFYKQYESNESVKA